MRSIRFRLSPVHKRPTATTAASSLVATSAIRQSLQVVNPCRNSALHKGQNTARSLLEIERHLPALCSRRLLRRAFFFSPLPSRHHATQTLRHVSVISVPLPQCALR